MEGHCILEGKQTDLEDEPEEGHECEGNSFAPDKETFAFSLGTSKRELEARRKAGEGAGSAVGGGR